MATRYTTAELHGSITDHDKRIGALEKNDGVQDEQIRNLRMDVDKTTCIAEDLQKAVITSQQAIKLGTWIVAAFGISVIALIWSLITGQAAIVFP